MDVETIQKSLQQQKKVRMFLVDITKIKKDVNKVVLNISYKIKFIDSARFMASSLSNLVDNLTEGIHKIKCKHECFLEYESVKDNLIKYKCLSCNKDYSNKLDEKFKKILRNTYKFSNNDDIKNFILFLRKGVCPYEYMHDWEKFNKITLPGKEEFYSNLNTEEITNEDYMHGKRVWKDFETKYFNEYHDLYLKSVTLLLSDVF